jgi:hypothetical protein
MPSMIGLIMLMGIATKNSILLIDYVIIARRDHGLSRWDALLDACHKRARPIIMTTIAMAAGMLPIAIGLGTDPSFRSPMAIVVIGGLITSTFLSLLVIPVLFTYVDDAVQGLQNLTRRLRRAGPASGQPVASVGSVAACRPATQPAPRARAIHPRCASLSPGCRRHLEPCGRNRCHRARRGRRASPRAAPEMPPGGAWHNLTHEAPVAAA